MRFYRLDSYKSRTLIYYFNQIFYPQMKFIQYCSGGASKMFSPFFNPKMHNTPGDTCNLLRLNFNRVELIFISFLDLCKYFNEILNIEQH